MIVGYVLDESGTRVLKFISPAKAFKKYGLGQWQDTAICGAVHSRASCSLHLQGQIHKDHECFWIELNDGK